MPTRSSDSGRAARRAVSGREGEFVRGFVKSGSAAAAVGRGDGAAGVAGIVAVEAIGREQQRRAVAYSRSRGQL